MPPWWAGPGEAKTGCINTIIYGVLRHGCHVWVADPKAVDFAWLEPHPNARRYPEENAPYAVRHAVKEMNSRRKWLMERGNGAVKISDVERDDRPPHLLVVLDELLEILVQGPKKKDEEGGHKKFTDATKLQLLQLAQRCRYVSMSVLIGMQRLDVSLLGESGGAFRAQLGARIALGQLDPQGEQMTFGALEGRLPPLPEAHKPEFDST